MEARDRSAVLAVASSTPSLIFRLGVKYLKMKRSANRARGRFYKELIRSGLPKHEAKGLSDQYVSAISIRSLIKNVRGDQMEEWLGTRDD